MIILLMEKYDIDFSIDYSEFDLLFGGDIRGRIFMMAFLKGENLVIDPNNKLQQDIFNDNQTIKYEENEYKIFDDFIYYQKIYEKLINEHRDKNLFIENKWNKIYTIAQQNDRTGRIYKNFLYEYDNKKFLGLVNAFEPKIKDVMDLSPLKDTFDGKIIISYFRTMNDVADRYINGNSIENIINDVEYGIKNVTLFNVDYGAILKEYIKYLRTHPETHLGGIEEKNLLQEIKQDEWKYDGEKYYKLINEEKKYSVDLITKESCYSTNATTDEKQCYDYMFNCLLSDNPINSAQCLKFLNDPNFFKEAKNQINSFTPEIALLMLQKLHFTQELENGKFKIISFDKWMQNVVPKYFHNINELLENEHFVSYIKLLIEFINANNKSILNHEKEKQSVGKMKSEKLDEFKYVKKRIDPNYSLSRQQLRSYNERPEIMLPKFPIILNGGCHIDKQENIFRNIFMELFDNLEKMGKTIDDKEKILNQINDLENIEKKIFEMNKILNFYLRLVGKFDKGKETKTLKEIEKINGLNKKLLTKYYNKETNLMNIFTLIKDFQHKNGTYEKPISIG